MIKRLGLDKYSALYLWAAFMLYFGITKNSTFISWTTFQLVLQENVFTAVLALAFLVPLATGTFDLSIGAQMSMSLVITSYFAMHHTMPAGLGAVIGILACGVGGWISGFIVVKLKVNSFIATLGMSQVISAFILHTSPQSINTPFSQAYMDFGAKPFFHLQRYFYMMLVVAVILWFVFEHTPLGRYMFATGGNPEAARLSGVKTDRLIWGSLVVSGLIAGFAGTVYSWKVGNYDSSIGPGYLFPAVAAVFFGASQLKGRANVWGALIAVYALSFGIWGLHLTFENSIWIDPMFQGLSLLIAVSIASRPAVVKLKNRKKVDEPTLPPLDVTSTGATA